MLKNKKILRPIQGLFLALGAPLGWLMIQSVTGINPIDDLSVNPGLYIYMAVGTALAFLVFGYYVGSYEVTIEDQALIDPLTRLGNRKKFYLLADYVFDRASRYKDNLSLAMMDIDHFKEINDTHGHAAGDKVLKIIANTISATLRKSDIPVRWGGEEFLFIMPDATLTQSQTIAERLRHNVEQGSYDEADNVTVSIGITEYINGDSLETMIKRADDALYVAKNSGRNRVSTKVP